MCLFNYYGKIEPLECKENYHEFQTKEEATEWGIKHYKEWGYNYKYFLCKMKESSLFNYSDIKINPIEYYAGHAYHQINNYKRHSNQDISLNMKINAEVLSLALLSAPPIPEDIIVYRMVTLEDLEKLIHANKATSHHYYYEKGFMSTSLTKDIALHDEYNDRLVLKIYVPRGKYGIFVDAIAIRGEYELLLQNNLYIRLCGKPYKDYDINKRIHECEISIN